MLNWIYSWIIPVPILKPKQLLIPENVLKLIVRSIDNNATLCNFACACRQFSHVVREFNASQKSIEIKCSIDDYLNYTSDTPSDTEKVVLLPKKIKKKKLEWCICLC